MLEQFLHFISKEKLCGKKDKVLLTVSGGVDSIVMCDLFHRAGFSFGIAHCNFKLRGKESDEDENFVRIFAEKYKVQFHKKKFNTRLFSEKKKISVQMAARDLRYDWLKRLVRQKDGSRDSRNTRIPRISELSQSGAKEKKPARHQNESMTAGGYDFIATAHHLDDSIETFFINILRGTGIAGLQGVPVKQGNIIRPLLFAGKKMIREYAEQKHLSWREDSSNFTGKYLRNTIRHHLIPSLKKLNAGFEKTITKELSYFKDAGEILKKFVEEKKKEIVVEEGKNILLNIRKLKDSGHAETILHELLRAYDFTPETTELIAQRMYTTAGKKFLSPTYRLIKDRDFFILTPKKATPVFSFTKKWEEEFFIKKNQTEFKKENLHLKLEKINGNLSEVKDKRHSVAYLDYSGLTFPLKIRKWKQGDFFYPLGMNGKKKLSDFFIDRKIPVSEKENIYVLESGGKIAWIIPHRIDDRFKVVPDTKNILKVALVA